jgi:hypothetical protein
VTFQVFTVASIKMATFSDTAPCSVVEVNQSFRGAYCLHNEGDGQVALMMVAVRTIETSDYYEATRRCHGNIRRHDNMKSHNCCFKSVALTLISKVCSWQHAT